MDKRQLTFNEFQDLARECTTMPVSILSITGNNIASKDALAEYLNRVRENSGTPFVVGFGISTREDVIWFNEYSDGAVVGSAIIKNMDGSSNPVETTKILIQNLKGIKL